MRRLAVLALVGVLAAASVATSQASAPPVGPLPKGTTTTIAAPAQSYVAVALNRGESGLVWRIARAFDSRVLVEQSERDIGALTVVVFRTVKPGTTTVRFALTNGERPKAYQAQTYKVTVRPR